MKFNYLKRAGVLSVLSLAVLSCQNDNNDDPKPETSAIDFNNVSSVPALVVAKEGFENLKITSMISSPDVLSGSPSFVYGAQPDGAGFMKDPNGDGYMMITNHEILQSVSRVYFDKTLKAVKGDYIVDGIGGMTRLCSATLATPAIHGFGPMFLTAGESGEESMVHGIDPRGLSNDKSRKDRILPALGKASMENAVPLTKEAYAGKTVILIGEDQSYGPAHTSAGQVIMYVSTVGELNNGKLYALKRNDGNQVETSMNVGSSFDVSFVEIPNAKNITGAEINTAVNTLGAIRFSRVEDIDYRKGSAKNNREIYFTATGQATNNAPVTGFTMWGRVYKLVLNDTNPLLGKLELVVEGDSTPGTGIINPDNLCVTENYVYIQEDGDSFYTDAKHDSYIWQYNIATKANKPWLTMNHKREDATWNATYNTAGGTMKLGSWEYGAMEDISDVIGVPNTFIVNVHPHTWKKKEFQYADGSKVIDNTEGGQTVIIRNVQK